MPAPYRPSPRPSTQGEIPQADRLDKLRQLVEAFAGGLSYVVIAERWPATRRNLSYYVQSAITLRLVRPFRWTYLPTHLGRELLATGPGSKAERSVLLRAIHAAPSLAPFWTYLEGGHLPEQELLRRIRAASRLNETTAVRRVGTLVSWREYLLACNNPKQLELWHHKRGARSKFRRNPMTDTAIPIPDSNSISVALRTDGPCITRTLEEMVGRPLSRDALERVKRQAEGFVENILRCYTRDVAPDEVGALGTARATDTDPTSGECPTGLLYGRIQSGKTAGMIVTAALAIDNGFRIVLVVTSDCLELVRQTQARFQDLNGPLLYSSRQNASGDYEWNADVDLIRREMPNRGLVLIVAKNAKHQEALLTFLRSIEANRYPALIMDDEADQATPDTTVRARSSGRGNAPLHGSTIFRKIVHNDRPNELGESLRETLRHNVFVQVTATPYALLLQNLDSALRAKGFTSLLEPGEGYVGGEAFFANLDDPAPPLVVVDERETQQIQQSPNVVPEGLARAIWFFLVSGAARFRAHGVPREGGFKFLCHTSPRTVDHATLAGLIRRCIGELPGDLESNAPAGIMWAYEELRKSLPNAPQLRDLLQFIAHRAPTRTMLMVNSAGDELSFGRYYNFVIGGNILGRGLTLDNLLTTYYLRRARRTQMDTMLQHARMYGYRQALLPYMRVFIPQTLATRFRQFHDTEVGLREFFQAARDGRRIPISVARGSAPSRASVLDDNEIQAYRPGQQVYPVEPATTREQLGDSPTTIQRRVEELFGGGLIANAYREVPLDAIIELVSEFRVLEDDSDWDAAAIGAVLSSISSDYDGTGLLYFREFGSGRPEPVFSSGTISGDEQGEARARRRPTLFAFRLNEATAARWGCARFWYPTIVFPSDMEVRVFNAS